MATVHFTRHLKQFFPDLQPAQVAGATVAEVVRTLDAERPGLGRYLCQDHGGLRPHVNVFVDGERIRDRVGLSDPLQPDSELMILQALSGG